jgi:hypothetical protein
VRSTAPYALGKVLELSLVCIMGFGVACRRCLRTIPSSLSRVLASMRIDHVIWFTQDLPSANAYFEARLDSVPAYGGVHLGDGTCNSLLSLGEATYLEILAFDAEQPRPQGELSSLSGQGLYHWAVGGVDLADIKARTSQAGIKTSGIVSGGRRVPEGKWIAWDTLGIADHGLGALVPFFIDWRDCPHPAASAPKGGRLAKLELVTPRAKELRALFAILGLDIDIAVGETPSISATIQTPRGREVLRSVGPLPQGFVI